MCLMVPRVPAACCPPPPLTFLTHPYLLPTPPNPYASVHAYPPYHVCHSILPLRHSLIPPRPSMCVSLHVSPSAPRRTPRPRRVIVVAAAPRRVCRVAPRESRAPPRSASPRLRSAALRASLPPPPRAVPAFLALRVSLSARRSIGSPLLVCDRRPSSRPSPFSCRAFPFAVFGPSSRVLVRGLGAWGARSATELSMH